MAQALSDPEAVRRQAALDRDESIARSISVRTDPKIFQLNWN